MDVFFRGDEISSPYIIYLIDPVVDISSFVEDIVVSDGDVYFSYYQFVNQSILFPGQSLAFNGYTALTFKVFGNPSLNIFIFINGQVLLDVGYSFRSEFYESSEFEKISYKEFDNYIECLAVGITLGSEFDILESMVRYILKNTQYLFDKYGRADGVLFPVSFAYAYVHLIFSLDEEKGYIRVEMQEKFTYTKVFLCGFKLVGVSIDFLKYFPEYKKSDCIYIVTKNSTPSIVGGNNQYYTKVETDIKLNELKSLIRAITTTPDPAGTSVTVTNNAVLKMDDNQLKALAHLILTR